MNQFARLEILVGNDNVEKIKNTSVLVIGLGGVGSFALESLVRNGVGNIIIVDADTVDITNLNRQLMTCHDNCLLYTSPSPRDSCASRMQS